MTQKKQQKPKRTSNDSANHFTEIANAINMAIAYVLHIRWNKVWLNHKVTLCLLLILLIKHHQQHTIQYKSILY